ncbi:MAG: hypothetical protein J6I65_00890 [Lachnospiraceae bacterium]|nr:hypothetical protein [Lachnospiraceae bacterium]
MVQFGRRRKIQFTDKTHPKRGIVSVIIGAVCMICTFALFIGAGRARGNAAAWYGYLGMITMLVAFTGLILGIRCFKEEDIYYTTPTAGVILNGLLTLCYVVLLFVGVL